MNLKAIMQRLENSRFGGLLQFVKFGLVGVSNTLISYAVEMLCYYVLLTDASFDRPAEALSFLSAGMTYRILWTNVLAFVISVTNSYYWNSRFVFKNGGVRRTAGQHVRAYLKTVACYALTGLLLAPWLKSVLSAQPSPGIPYWAASLLTLIITIPLNFVLNKFWAFGERRESSQEDEP